MVEKNCVNFKCNEAVTMLIISNDYSKPGGLMINIEYCEYVLVSKVCVEYLPTKINGGSRVHLAMYPC